MLNIYRHMADLLNKGECFIVATILDRNGSAPRDKGAKMIIKEDLSIIGTIGGGILEALAIKSAKEVLENKSTLIRRYNLSNRGAAQLGMVCGGEMEILEEYMDSEDKNVVRICERAAYYWDKGISFVVLTDISGDAVLRGKWLITEDYAQNADASNGADSSANGSAADTEKHILYTLIDSLRENMCRLDIEKLSIRLMEYGGIRYIVEPVKGEETVYITGAGHIGIQLSKLTSLVGFKTVVIDDRKEFASKERFPEADGIVLVDSFENILNYIDINTSDYVVIVTRGHMNDRDVLARVLKTNAKYIGMIGSREKREHIYNSLRQEGFSENDLGRVHSPIGLDIHAETPEEIAVSIIAEMIKERRNVRT